MTSGFVHGEFSSPRNFYFHNKNKFSEFFHTDFRGRTFRGHLKKFSFRQSIGYRSAWKPDGAVGLLMRKSMIHDRPRTTLFAIM